MKKSMLGRTLKQQQINEYRRYSRNDKYEEVQFDSHHYKNNDAPS